MAKRLTMDESEDLRSLRELEKAVAEHVMGVKPSSRPDMVFSPPRYTTWAGMEEIIAKLESRGLVWSVSLMYPGKSDAFYAEISSGRVRHSRYARSPGVALCLAALASAGLRVSLELGEKWPQK